MQVADGCLQLGHAVAHLGRRWQLDGDDVVLQIGLGIHPGRIGQVQRHPPQATAQHRHQRQALGHVAAQVLQKAALEARR